MVSAETADLENRHRFRHLPPTAVPIQGSDLRSGLASILNSNGAVARFRTLLAERTGSPGCYLVSSGRAALTVILLALKRLSARSRVVVPAYGCPTVPQAVLRAGLEPVLCDVSPLTLDLDRAALRHLINSDLLAIVPVHLYGLAQDVTDLMAVGREFDIFVIEDAAQAFGARLKGRMVGNWGDAGLYSLGRGKCLPTGHGGIIVSRGRCATAISEVVREIVRDAPEWDIGSLALFLGYGLATRPRGWWFVVRTPLNPAKRGMDLRKLPPIRLIELSAVQAGIGASIVARLDEIHKARRENAGRLMDELTELHFVTLPEISPGAEPVFLRLPMVVDGEERANKLFDLLWREGIGVSRSYRRTLADLFSDTLCSNGKDFPGASRLATCLLTLPTHSYLKEGDISRIVRAFQNVDRQNRK